MGILRGPRAALTQIFPWPRLSVTVASMPEPVEVSVGGRTYRVVASAEQSAVRRLADVVDARLRELSGPGSPLPPQALLLAAISLANDLEEERERRREVTRQSRERLRQVLARIDAAIDAADQEAQRPAAPARDDSRPTPRP